MTDGLCCLEVTNKESGQEVNAGETKFSDLFTRMLNKIITKKVVKKSFVNVVNFRYLGTVAY